MFVLVRAIKTIMIVDDETSVIEKVKSFLGDNELDIISANNSRQALEIIQTRKNLDLILIDTLMPGTKKSALYSTKPNSKLSSIEGNTFLQKPFTKDQLINFIRKNIDK